MTSTTQNRSIRQNPPEAETAGQNSDVTWETQLPQTTVVVFSKDRPLQLDGTLRSFFARWSIKFSAEYYEAKDAAIADPEILSQEKPKS